MRRRFALPLLFAAIGASGCSAGLRGVWAGSCIVIGDRDPFEVPLEVELVYDRQGILMGNGAYDFNGYTFHGTLEGTVGEEAVEFAYDGVYGGYLVEMAVKGRQATPTRIEGTCSFFDGAGPVTLERVGDE
jgi:hypothetical protein